MTRWRSRALRTGLGVSLLLSSWCTPKLSAQDLQVRNDSLQIRLVNSDLRAAIQALGRFLPKPVVAAGIGEVRVEFFETPQPITADEVPALLRGLVEAHGLLFSDEPNLIRISPVPVAAEPAAGAAASGPQAVVFALFTVRLRHARAADVAATLNQLYGAGQDLSRPAGLSRGSLSDELRADREGLADGADREVDAGPEGATLQRTVTVVPDELTNSLLIRSTQQDFDVLQEGIAQLDVRPLQVLIEVVIVEARKDRQFLLGFGVDVPPRDLAEGTIEGTLLGAGLGDLVVRIMNLGRERINGTLTAARSRGDVEILSRPVILASNNAEASLLVGTQQPFVQVSRSLPTDAPQRDQVVQYREVGTKLTVRPTINQDGYVSMLVQQEISAATGEMQFDAPVISSREATTQVLVADRQTIVIGGLRDQIRDQIRTGIPLLADIPLIGGLFGSTSTRSTETELFLFITPTILASDEDAALATRSKLPRKIIETLDKIGVPLKAVEPVDSVTPPGGSPR